MKTQLYALLFFVWTGVCITAGAGLSVWYYSGKVAGLNSEIDKCTAANIKFKSSAELQNLAIKSLNDFATVQAGKYAELLKQPEKVRFKTKYIEVKSNECADIKNIINDIRANGF